MFEQELIDLDLREDATLWPLLAQDGDRNVFGSPVPIKVRWEDGVSRFVPGTQERITSETVVFTDRDVTVGDRLFRGSSASVDPESLEGTYPVKIFSRIPNALVPVAVRRKATL